MANSTIAVSFTTTTLLGSHLGLSNLLPVAYNPQREFTLNNHLNICIFVTNDSDKLLSLYKVLNISTFLGAIHLILTPVAPK